MHTAHCDRARPAATIPELPVARLREAWPKVRIVMRAASGFRRQRLTGRCERDGVEHVIALARNPQRADLTASETAQLEADFEASGETRRPIFEPRHAAKTWRRERRVIARFERASQGPNPRFAVTDREGEARALYEAVRCARGCRGAFCRFTARHMRRCVDEFATRQGLGERDHGVPEGRRSTFPALTG